MERAIEEDEVKKAPCCVGVKALGPDGFSLPFFSQYCLNIVIIDVMDSIVEFQDSGEFEKSSNASFIVIIPKREGAMSMKD